MPAEPMPPMHFQIDAEKGLAIMKITTFAYWVVDKSIKDYADFFEESFEKLEKQDIKHLIIDIRNNRVGEEMIGAELLTYLINTDFEIYKFGKANTLDFSYTNKLPKANKIKLPKKHYVKTDSGYILQKGDFLRTFQPKTSNKFSGQVYVLSNNRCWSAANNFLALVKTHQVATIIGQESGGSFEDVDGRQRVNFTLPYSKMKVSYPVWSFRIDSKGGDRLRGVVPDHIITRSLEDLISKNDVELSFTYQLIKNQ